jgi:membrane protein required for beta-lactamase induction
MGHMSEQSSGETSHRSFGRTALAAVIGLVAAYLLLGFIIHIVSFIFSTLIFIVAVVAVVWALRVLL